MELTSYFFRHEQQKKIDDAAKDSKKVVNWGGEKVQSQKKLVTSYKSFTFESFKNVLIQIMYPDRNFCLKLLNSQIY